ncbi:MAG: trypsin-like peptidase domain-containing protein [Coraliomargarita sp.]|nr:trypsin-like peptidase domain-containing protein [Coraliomargarita sp.]
MLRFVGFLYLCFSGFLAGQQLEENFRAEPESQDSDESENDSEKSLAQRLLEERIEELKEELEKAESELARLVGHEQPNRKGVTYVSREDSGALVVVRSDNSSGSGFIARLKDKTFFVTNIHVLGAARGAELTTVNGEAIKLTPTAYVSKRRDLAIVPIDWSGRVLDISKSLNFDNVEIGESVTVMGNSSGANVTTRLDGVIRGIGPNEIEVSAEFVPGNSGSPIIHNELGVVIGIAAYLRDFRSDSKWTEGTEFNDIRCFGYRLDGAIEWQAVALDDLYRQAEAYALFEDRTEVMWNVSHQLRYESNLLTAYRDHDSLGHLYEDISSGFDWNRGTASPHNSKILGRFINQMMNESQNDVSETREQLKVDFYRRSFDRIVDYRETVRNNLSNFAERRL